MDMIVALLLVLVLVLCCVVSTQSSNKGCSGHCYQGRRCDCKENK